MRRKEILPKWIRFFAWIYLLMFIAPLIFLLGLTGVAEVSFMIFGLSYEGTTSLHPTAIAVTLICTLSATVAYGILWGKDWAPQLGIIYGWVGLATCGVAFFLKLNTGTLYLPLEPILIIPFMTSLSKKRREWMDYASDLDETNEVEQGV